MEQYQVFLLTLATGQRLLPKKCNTREVMNASSETQGQLVGTTGFSWAKVYNKSGRAPGHLLLPIQFSPSDWPEKCFSGQSAKRNSRATLLSSYTRLFSSSIAVVAWPGNIFEGRFRKKNTEQINEVEEIANYNVAGRKQTLTGIFHGGLIEGIANF